MNASWFFTLSLQVFFLFASVEARAAPEASGLKEGESCFVRIESESEPRMRTIRDRIAQFSGALSVRERKKVRNLLGVSGSPLATWCSEFNTAKALPRWREIKDGFEGIWGASRERWLNGFSEWVVACQHTPEVYRNTAFLLDWMYWNRQIDRLGLEVADALDIRDEFYEYWVLSQGLEFIQHQRNLSLSRGPRPELASDFLSAEPMNEASILEFFGSLLNAFDRKGREIVRRVADRLNLRQGSVVIYGQDVLRILENPADLEFLQRVGLELKRLSAGGRRDLGAAHGGWRKWLELSGRDPERVIRVLGVMASMRTWILDEVGVSLARRGQLSCEKLLALQQGANAYFRMNALDERAAETAQNGRSVAYHYFYPAPYITRDWKIYHWYANAHLGCGLVRDGVGANYIRYGAESLAKAYEFATLNLGGPSRVAMGLDPRVRPILEGWADIQLNTEGAVFGAAFCRNLKR
jgi:hypothetical protein